MLSQRVTMGTQRVHERKVFDLLGVRAQFTGFTVFLQSSRNIYIGYVGIGGKTYRNKTQNNNTSNTL